MFTSFVQTCPAMEQGAEEEVMRGVRAGLPVAVGYVPMAMAFGVLATQTGLGFFQAGAMSMFVYAGASQFASLGLLAGGASALAIVLATLVLNFRHFLMSVALSRRLPLRQGTDHRARLLPLVLGFGITDETFVVASLEERLTVRYFLGLIVTVYLAWLIAWDYLWFVLNPYWGVSRFRRGQVWWYPGLWIGRLPLDYYVAVVLSFAVAALAWPLGHGAGALADQLVIAVILATTCLLAMAAAPAY